MSDSDIIERARTSVGAVDAVLKDMTDEIERLQGIEEAANALRLKLWTDRHCSPVDTAEYRALDELIKKDRPPWSPSGDDNG